MGRTDVGVERPTREQMLRSQFKDGEGWRSPLSRGHLRMDRDYLLGILDSAERGLASSEEEYQKKLQAFNRARDALTRAQEPYMRDKDNVDVIKLALREVLEVTD